MFELNNQSDTLVSQRFYVEKKDYPKQYLQVLYKASPRSFVDFLERGFQTVIQGLTATPLMSRFLLP